MSDLGSTNNRVDTVHIGTGIDANGTSVTATELGYVAGVTSALQTQISAKAADSAVVHLSGSESVTGAKTFSANIILTAGSTDASTFTLMNGKGGDGGSRWNIKVQTTTGISSATTIFALSQPSNFVLCQVSDGAGNVATDLLWAGSATNPTVISSYTGGGSPATRTFTRSSANLQLAMGSGTYTANVWVLELRAR